MKILKFFILFFLFINNYLFSQSNVGIGTNTPDNSAILELNSSDKGFLITRLTNTQRNGIINPAVGLIIFNTDANQFQFFNGSIWLPISNINSIGLITPNIFTVSPYPLINNGDITISLVNQSANTVFAAPDQGSGSPTFRALVANDIPNLNTDKISSGIFPVIRGGTGEGNLTGMLKGNGTNPFTGITNTSGNITFWSDNNTIGGDNKLTYDFSTNLLSLDGYLKLSPKNTPPVSPSESQIYYDDNDNKYKYWDGTLWKSFDGSSNLPIGTNNQTIRNNSGIWEATSLLRMTTTNLGIGESSFSPIAPLHIDFGNSVDNYIKFTGGTTTGTTLTDGFDIGIESSGNAIITQKENLPILFYTNSTERLKINGGYGGLRVNVSDNSDLVSSLNLNNTSNASISMSLTNSVTGNNTNNGLELEIDGSGNGFLTQNTTGTKLTFRTGSSDRVVIDGSGNVGIGEVNPSVRLHINGAIVTNSETISTSNVSVSNKTYIKLSYDGSISLDAGITGQYLIIHKVGSGSITLNDDSGTKLNGNWVGGLDDTITLIYDGNNWIELSRSDN